MTGFAQDRGLKKAGVTAAARGVSLQDIDRAGGEHALEVGDVVAVLAGRDIHSRRAVIAHQAQAIEVIR